MFRLYTKNVRIFAKMTDFARYVSNEAPLTRNKKGLKLGL